MIYTTILNGDSARNNSIGRDNSNMIRNNIINMDNDAFSGSHLFNNKCAIYLEGSSGYYKAAGLEGDWD